MITYSFVQISSVQGPLEAAPDRGYQGRGRALAGRAVWRCLFAFACVSSFLLPARASLLWSDLGATLAHETGPGSDILAGAVKRDQASTDILYFKFHVDPLSDIRTEEYFAAFELFEGDTERLAVGNSLQAWAYSAFNTSGVGEYNKVFGDIDLNSTRPESATLGKFLPYECPRRGIESTIVFKVEYVPGEDARITAWLNPDLAPGATESGQPEALTTRFRAKASFDQIRLRHGGGGSGWTFSDMAIATAFSDLVAGGNPELQSGANVEPGAVAFTFHAWQREQGLPHNSVQALLQTRDGYLWVGTDEGLARFDGVQFVSLGFGEAGSRRRVRVLLEDSRGALWAGTAGGGLTRWQGGRPLSLTVADGLPSDSVSALAEDSQGRIWIGTEGGLASWKEGHLSVHEGFSGFKGRAIAALCWDRQGSLWVGVSGIGIFHLDGDRFVPLATPSASILQDPHSLLVDRAGRLWAGVGDDYLLCREGQEWRRYRIPRRLARPFVSALAEERDGTVWAGSVSEGLFCFREGKLTALNAGSGLSDNLVTSLLVDREGNIWVGTAAGLNRLRRKQLTIFGPNEGLGYGPVHGLAEVGPGAIWAGKPSDGLYRRQNHGFARLGLADSRRGLPAIGPLLLAADRSCWVAAEAGLLRFPDPLRLPEEVEPVAVRGGSVLALCQDREGGIWAGTREGILWRCWDGKWTAQSNWWHGYPVTALAEDREGGTMWVGTEGRGLFRLGPDTRASPVRQIGPPNAIIRAIYPDSSGNVWIGTAGNGLWSWQAGTLTMINLSQGLPDDTVSQIIEDDFGRLWLGTQRGIACVAKKELVDCAQGKIASIYPQLFGRAEGMVSEECAGGFWPAGLKSQAGELWFPTLKGLVMVEPRPMATNATAPMVIIEEVLVDGIVFPVYPTRGANLPAVSQGPLRIAPGKHRIEFRYTGLSFSAPSRVRFRYWLAGLDSEWVEAGTRRTAFYGYVPPGDYRFQVVACSGEGVWNSTGASLTFQVPRHWWQARWLQALAGASVLLLVGGGARMLEMRRHRRRVALLEQERALERERARIAQDLHDDLGASLTRIALLSDLARADKDNPNLVETHANKISRSAEQTVRALDEIVWALRPGSDSLQSLVDYIAHFANELFDGDHAHCRLDFPADLPACVLPPDVRHGIFLVVKEALTNAFKHAGAQEVQVRAKAAGSMLEITIADDGCGFEIPASPAPMKRHGLRNMRARAEAMGGSLSIQSRPGRGTALRLAVRIPL